jgi:hypothetical protein
MKIIELLKQSETNSKMIFSFEKNLHLKTLLQGNKIIFSFEKFDKS